MAPAALVAAPAAPGILAGFDALEGAGAPAGFAALAALDVLAGVDVLAGLDVLDGLDALVGLDAFSGFDPFGGSDPFGGEGGLVPPGESGVSPGAEAPGGTRPGGASDGARPVGEVLSVSAIEPAVAGPVPPWRTNSASTMAELGPITSGSTVAPSAPSVPRMTA